MRGVKRRKGEAFYCRKVGVGLHREISFWLGRLPCAASLTARSEQAQQRAGHRILEREEGAAGENPSLTRKVPPAPCAVVRARCRGCPASTEGLATKPARFEQKEHRGRTRTLPESGEQMNSGANERVRRDSALGVARPQRRRSGR